MMFNWMFILVWSQQSFVLLLQYIDTSTITVLGIAFVALHRHLYRHGSNYVALPCKCQSDLVITTMMKRRSGKHTKTSSWFVNTKVDSLLHILVVVKKKETEYELS